MRFGRSLVFVYEESWAFILRGWWLVILLSLASAAPALAEAIIPQGWDGATLWSALGLAAVLRAALAYVVMRFIALGHDFAAAVSVNGASARTFAPYLVAMSLFNVLTTGAGYYADTGTSLAIAILVLFVLPLLSPWSVTAPSGSTVIGPIRSIRLVLPHIFWAAAFTFVAVIPLLLVQTAADALLFLSYGALENYAPPIADALVWTVGDLITLAALFVVARRAGVRIGADRTLASVFD